MIFTDNLTAISNAQNGQVGVLLSDIVLIANILKSGEIDTTVVGDFGTYIEVNGLIDTTKFIGRYVVVGREIVKITSVTKLTTTSEIYVDRAQLGTINSYADDGIDFEINPNYSFRTATIFEGVKSFDINSNTGNNSEIFSFQVESSSVVINIDPTEMKDWNQSLTTRKYNTKPTKTVVYLFRGLNVGEGSRMLTYTGFLKRAYPSAKRGESIVTLDIKDKFVKWNTKEMDKSFEIKNATPKTFFNAVLDIPQNMVIYGGGLSEENFRLVSGIYTKEFSTYNELLDAYCKQGVRFCFDELERVKVFCDFDGLVVQPDLEIPINETNITDISLDPNNQLIRNFITSNYKERKPMFDFENDLDGKYKKFNYSKAISNYQLVSTDNEFNVLTITETSADENSVFKRTLISDYVLLKDNLNNLQFYGRVLNKIVDGTNLTSEILMGRFDKDYVLNVYGKYDYLTNLGYNLPRNFTVHYGIVELPLIFQLAFDNISGQTVTSNMQIALLPQIQDDTTEYVKTFECGFGSADDLEIGTYSGYFEQISQAFGTWDNTKLFYNRELDQFNGTNPPLAVLSNRATKNRDTNTDNILTYTTFDNSNLALQVLSSYKSDMALKFKNTLTIPSSELHIDTPTEWLSSTLIKVSSLAPYKVGDVLTLNKPNTWTNVAQQNNYADVSGIRYVIDGIVDEGVGQRYLILNNGYPYSSTYPMFSFTRYKYEHIVYLQEMYMRGNPVIELDSNILEKNATSIAEFEKQNYEIDGRFYDRFGLTDFIDYMIRGYAGVEEDRSDFKQILPFKCRDHYQIQRGDIIKLKDDIYTGTSSDDLFYVLGVQHIARSSEMNVWVINVNKFNADGSRYTLDEKLSYRPIETTYYSYTDSNSDVGSAYIVSTDSVMGALSLNRISRSDMRADILEIADNKITFNNFSGNNLATYKDTVFSTTEKVEFVALIGNEYVYMKSYDNGDISGNTESAVIVHRGLFSSTEENITTTSTVTFYSIIAGTSTEGVMASTSAFIGTDSDYLKFKPAIGLEVKTSGEVDISNDNNRMYFDPSNVDNKSQILLDVGTIVGKKNIPFQVGSTSGGYIKFENNSVEMNVANFKIKGSNMINVIKTLDFKNITQFPLYKKVISGIFILTKPSYYAILDIINEIETFAEDVNIKNNYKIFDGITRRINSSTYNDYFLTVNTTSTNMLKVLYKNPTYLIDVYSITLPSNYTINDSYSRFVNTTYDGGSMFFNVFSYISSTTTFNNRYYYDDVLFFEETLDNSQINNRRVYINENIYKQGVDIYWGGVKYYTHNTNNFDLHITPYEDLIIHDKDNLKLINITNGIEYELYSSSKKIVYTDKYIYVYLYGEKDFIKLNRNLVDFDIVSGDYFEYDLVSSQLVSTHILDGAYMKLFTFRDGIGGISAITSIVLGNSDL